MTARTKPKHGRARPGFVRAAWRERVHPAFLAWWLARKWNGTLPNIKDKKEQERQFKEWYKAAAKASRELNEAMSQIANPISPKISSAILRRLDIESPILIPPISQGEQLKIYPQNPESSDLFRMLVFLKLGITFRELMRKIDIEQDHAAHGKLIAVHRDYLRVLSGVDVGALKLKFRWVHFEIITQGLDFGIDRLTSGELVDCLDQICPCGQRHSVEYLKKVRSHIIQAGNELI